MFQQVKYELKVNKLRTQFAEETLAWFEELSKEFPFGSCVLKKRFICATFKSLHGRFEFYITVTWNTKICNYIVDNVHCPYESIRLKTKSKVEAEDYIKYLAGL